MGLALLRVFPHHKGRCRQGLHRPGLANVVLVSDLIEPLLDLHYFVVLTLRFFFRLFKHGNHVQADLYFLV